MCALICRPDPRWLAGGLACLWAVAGAAGDLRAIPLPRLDPDVNRLIVAHAVNPRLPRMDEARLRTLLAEAREVVERHFGVPVQFTEPETIGIDKLFGYLPPHTETRRRTLIFDFKAGRGDRGRLVAAMRSGLEHSMRINGTPFEAEYGFARRHLLAPPATHDVDGLAGSLVRTMLARLAVWTRVKALDGRPVVDASPYNEWALWDGIGYGALPYDVVLTNQLVASAEYEGLAVHSSLRGGITTGTTTYSRQGRFHTFVFFSTFPFETGYPALAAQRRRDRYTPDEAARFAGAYLAHELGHLLFHLGHPFGKPACVMRPAELLDFRTWYEAIDASRCPLGSHPAMVVGRPRIFFDPDG